MDFAKLTGDFNPIHVDPEFAAGSHFGRTVAHGMMVAAAISEMMTVAFREDWAHGGKLKIRFRNPVFPGETVTAFGKVKAIETGDGARAVTCTVGVRNEGGEPAITGEAVVRIER